MAYSIMGGLVKSSKIEVTEKLYQEVNKIVQSYIDQGVAKVVSGVIFIDEVCPAINKRLWTVNTHSNDSIH